MFDTTKQLARKKRGEVLVDQTILEDFEPRITEAWTSTDGSLFAIDLYFRCIKTFFKQWLPVSYSSAEV